MKIQYGIFAAIDIKYVDVVIKGGGASEEVTVTIGEGNVSWDEKRNVDYLRDGGALDDVRQGDEEPMDVRLDGTFEYYDGTAGSPNPLEAIKGVGAASGWTSTDSDACRPFAVDIIIKNAPQPAGCGDSEDIILPDFRWEQVSFDVRNSTISFTGKCNVTEATSTRTAAA